MIFNLIQPEKLPETTIIKLYDIFEAINFKYYLTELFYKKDNSTYISSISNAILKYCSSIENDIYFELKNFNETTIIPLKIKKYNNQFYILPKNLCVNNLNDYHATIKKTLNIL